MMLLLFFYLFLSVIVFPRHINIYICLATVGFMFNIKITNKQTKNKKQKKNKTKQLHYLLSINFNLLSLLLHCAYHQITDYEIYTALTTNVVVKCIGLSNIIVLPQIIFSVYIFLERRPL